VRRTASTTCSAWHAIPDWRQHSSNSSRRPRNLCLHSGKPARVFRDFRYCTLNSWSRTRRVVGKAEHTLDGSNPRFIVTSLKCTRLGCDARALYEDLYCARGEAENRIGEQFEMFADRASSATMAANQLRMSFSAMAYVLVDTLRRVALRHTQFADAAARPFASSCSSSAPRCAPACAAFTSPSPRAALTRPSSRSHTSIFNAPSVPPDAHPRADRTNSRRCAGPRRTTRHTRLPGTSWPMDSWGANRR
jgi:hypothetical protein